MRGSVAFLLSLSVTIVLFPLSLALVEAAPPGLPDLQVNQMWLDGNNFLVFEISNQGNGVVPAGVGTFSIFVDGGFRISFPLGNLDDQSFRNPGGRSTVHTNIRLAGKHRRVAVVIDPDSAIKEENEFQNSMMRTLNPAPLRGPHIIVKDIGLTAANRVLYFTLANVGNQDTPPDLELKMRVTLNDTWLASDFTYRPSVLRARGANIEQVFPVPPVVAAPPYSRFRVQVSTRDAMGQIDNTNNGMRRTFPHDPLKKYTSLLGNPSIKTALVWQDRSGARSYDEWPPSMKKELAAYLLRLEERKTMPLDQPPRLTGNRLLPSTDARAIYLAHIAHNLWVDADRITSWTLTALSVEPLRCLLDSRWLFSYLPLENKYSFDTGKMRSFPSWDPRVPYEFLKVLVPSLSDQGVLPPTFEQIVFALMDWMRAHLIPVGEVRGTVEASQTPWAESLPYLDEILYPAPGKRHRGWGAAEIVALFATVLRSVNIPVNEEQSNGSNPASPGGAPGRLRFYYTGDLHLRWADDLLNPIFAPSGNAIPITKVFLHKDEIGQLIGNPALDCTPDRSRCNTIQEQAAYNIQKRFLQAAREYLQDFILQLRCSEERARFKTFLQGEYVRPYFTTTELNAFVAAIEAKIRDQGSGNWNEGCRFVTARWRRFLENR